MRRPDCLSVFTQLSPTAVRFSLTVWYLQAEGADDIMPKRQMTSCRRGTLKLTEGADDIMPKGHVKAYRRGR